MTDIHATFSFLRGARALFILALALFLLAGAAGAVAVDRDEGLMVTKCRSDLAKRLGRPFAEIKVVETQATTFTDAGLGLPRADEMVAKVITPGWKITLENRGAQYLYTAAKNSFRYGGPVDLWACSLLALEPIENDPNMNGNLYQQSLAGTGAALIATEVTDFFPQANGYVIVKRRTSRSGHDLLLVRAGEQGKPTRLQSAMDFGGAALNAKGDAWAAVVRPRLGTDWVLRAGGLDLQVAAKEIALPAGVTGGQVAWVEDKVLILVGAGGQMACYEIVPAAADPLWQKVAANTFPGLRSYMLNKSESLEITQRNEDGKPAVEVARVWFTGDRTVLATIPGLTLRGEEFLGMRFAVVWGEKGGKAAAFTVDIRTGEVLASCKGDAQAIKPFECAPICRP